VRHLILSAIIFFITPVSAEIYKWTDEDGKIHYGDKVTSKYKSKSDPVKLEKSITLSYKKPQKPKTPKKRKSLLDQRENQKTKYQRMEEARKSSDKLMRDYARKQNALANKRYEQRKKDYVKNKPCRNLGSNTQSKWAKQLKEKCKADYLRSRY
jgi:hypothetical protein